MDNKFQMERFARSRRNSGKTSQGSGAALLRRGSARLVISSLRVRSGRAKHFRGLGGEGGNAGSCAAKG